MASEILIDIMNENNFDAGTKARNDVRNILSSMGFQTVVLFNRTHNNIKRIIEIINASQIIGKTIKNKDLIVLQYPYQPKVMQLLINRINRIRKKTKCTFVILIHDVLYLRNENNSKNSIDLQATEVKFFNEADAVIVHNHAMKEELSSAGVSAKMFELGIFDYLYCGEPAFITHSAKTTIVFAGNLSPEKSGFIYKYNETGLVAFNLYGTKPDNLNSCFEYKGSYSPENLIEALEGNYGLVWDGPSPDSCIGNYGNYLRYNNPHKLSLYIAAGLPVVVWKESALADYVVDNSLGVTISSLSELPRIPNPNSMAYQYLLQGVRELQSKLQSGEMLKSVILAIYQELYD